MTIMKLSLIFLCSIHSYVVSQTLPVMLHSGVDAIQSEYPQTFPQEKEKYLTFIEESLNDMYQKVKGYMIWAELRSVEEGENYWLTQLCILIWNVKVKPGFVKSCTTMKYLIGKKPEYKITLFRRTPLNKKHTGDFLQCFCHYIPENDASGVVEADGIEFFVGKNQKETYFKLESDFRYTGNYVPNKFELIVIDYLTPDPILFK